jgi:cold shock CspA family protein
LGIAKKASLCYPRRANSIGEYERGEMENERKTIMTGTVFRWNPHKGIGSCAAEDGSVYFIHHSAVNGGGRVNFKPGDRITFDAVHTQKQGDDIAVNISLVN